MKAMRALLFISILLLVISSFVNHPARIVGASQDTRPLFCPAGMKVCGDICIDRTEECHPIG